MSHKRPDWMPRVYDADRFAVRHYSPFVDGRYVGADDCPPWLPEADEIQSYHDRMLITRLLDPEFLHGYRQALVELYNELDQEAAWENEGGLCHLSDEQREPPECKCETVDGTLPAECWCERGQDESSGT